MFLTLLAVIYVALGVHGYHLESKKDPTIQFNWAVAITWPWVGFYDVVEMLKVYLRNKLNTLPPATDLSGPNVGDEDFDLDLHEVYEKPEILKDGKSAYPTINSLNAELIEEYLLGLRLATYLEYWNNGQMTIVTPFRYGSPTHDFLVFETMENVNAFSEHLKVPLRIALTNKDE